MLKTLSWKKNGRFPNDIPFLLNCNFIAYRDFTSFEFFELFFDENLFELMVCESNCYALFRNYDDPKISVIEMKCFNGTFILSGYNISPGKQYFWEQGSDMRNVAVYNVMRRNRFDTIIRCLHFADNTMIDTHDKFYKLRLFVNLLQGNFLKHFQPASQFPVKP